MFGNICQAFFAGAENYYFSRQNLWMDWGGING